MYMTREKNIVYYFLICLVYCFEILEKNSIFLKIILSISKSEAGVCLAMCLKFPEFKAWCAFKLVAYKQKRVHVFF